MSSCGQRVLHSWQVRAAQLADACQLGTDLALSGEQRLCCGGGFLTSSCLVLCFPPPSRPPAHATCFTCCHLRLTQCRQQLLQELQAQQAQQTQHAAGETASSALSDLHLDEVAAEQLQRQAAAGAAADAALDAPKPGGQQEGQAATGADNGAAIGTPATNSDGQLEGQKGGQQQQGEEERQQQQQGEEGREEKRQQQQGGEEWEREAALRSRLGAVCGCLGDAARGSGEWEGAAAYYAESVGQLRLAGGSGEVGAWSTALRVGVVEVCMCVCGAGVKGGRRRWLGEGMHVGGESALLPSSPLPPSLLPLGGAPTCTSRAPLALHGSC